MWGADHLLLDVGVEVRQRLVDPAIDRPPTAAGARSVAVAGHLQRGGGAGAACTFVHNGNPMSIQCQPVVLIVSSWWSCPSACAARLLWNVRPGSFHDTSSTSAPRHFSGVLKASQHCGNRQLSRSCRGAKANDAPMASIQRRRPAQKPRGREAVAGGPKAGGHAESLCAAYGGYGDFWRRLSHLSGAI